MKKSNIYKYTLLALLCAISYVSIYFIHFPIIPSASFLSCDVRDVPILIGSFMFGPLYSILMALVISLIQMFTVSNFGIIGFLMNVVSSVSFVLPAAAVYRLKKSMASAITGLCVGCMCMTAVMLLWNFIVTPIYMNVPRETVKGMLIPVFLPFNLIKSVINAIISFVMYKLMIKRLSKLFENEGNKNEK